MELQARRIAAPEGDVPTISLASGPSRVVGEVLALVNCVPKKAGAILDAQSTVDPITVRIPVPIRYHLHPSLD